MPHALGIVILLMSFISTNGYLLPAFAALLFLAALGVRAGAKRLYRKDISVAACAKTAVYVTSLVVAALTFISPRGSSGLSTPLGRLLAQHWQSGSPTDCSLCPDRLFVVICDEDKHPHVHSLRELAAARTVSGTKGRSGDFGPPSCGTGNGFRLRRPSGAYAAPYDADDPGFREEVSYRVVRVDDAAQTIEVHYQDSMRDITDALFRYEVRKGQVIALESQVIPRKLVGIFGLLALVALGLLLAAGTHALYRFVKARRQLRPGSHA